MACMAQSVQTLTPVDSAAKKRFTDEKRAIVAAQIARLSMHADQSAEYLDHTLGTDRTGDINRHTFPGVLVDHCLAFQLLAIGTRVEVEVIAPPEVAPQRPLA